LCKHYHTNDVTAEIVGRITYEVVFGFLDVEHVIAGTWLSFKKTTRDYGHTLRLRNLATIALHKGVSVVRWLHIGAALEKHT
jgi:hypothetical protein